MKQRDEDSWHRNKDIEWEGEKKQLTSYKCLVQSDGKRLYWQCRVKMTHQRWPCLNEDKSFTIWYYCVGKKIHIKTTRETLQRWYHKEEMTQRKRSSGQLRLFCQKHWPLRDCLSVLRRRRHSWLFQTITRSLDLAVSFKMFTFMLKSVFVLGCFFFFKSKPHWQIKSSILAHKLKVNSTTQQLH